MVPNDVDETVRALHALGEKLGIGPLDFDENGNCALVLDDVLRIGIIQDPQTKGLVLHNLVGVLDATSRASQAEALLEANLFWAGTDGATLGIARSTGEVFLTQKLAASEVDVERLSEAIASLASVSEYWAAALKDVKPDAGVADIARVGDFA